MYFFHKKTSESLSIYGYIEDNVIYIESICMYFVEMVIQPLLKALFKGQITQFRKVTLKLKKNYLGGK